MAVYGIDLLSFAGVSLCRYSFSRLAVLSYIFGNDVQILLVRVDLSGWFSLSVLPFSYVVGVGCSTFVLFCEW